MRTDFTLWYRDSSSSHKNSWKWTMLKLAETFKFYRRTVKRQVETLGFRRKEDNDVSHQLIAYQRYRGIANCVSLLSRYRNKPFLTGVMLGDEKWVMHYNVNLRGLWFAFYNCLHRQILIPRSFCWMMSEL